MKESIGAGWIMVIVLTFITLFSGYLAFSINYSKAFSLKDAIVEKIEKTSGYKKDSTQKDIYDFMNTINYYSFGSCKKTEEGSQIWGVEGMNTPDPNPKGSKYNYCVEKHKSKSYNDGQMSYSYYSVSTFFTLDIPIINQLSTFAVNGETTEIYFADDKI